MLILNSCPFVHLNMVICVPQTIMFVGDVIRADEPEHSFTSCQNCIHGIKFFVSLKEDNDLTYKLVTGCTEMFFFWSGCCLNITNELCWWIFETYVAIKQPATYTGILNISDVQIVIKSSMQSVVYF